MMQLLDPITVIDEMPARLKQAFHLKQQLAQQNVFFAPIRHHSPACAFALKQYINEIKPTHILIEAPTSFEFLIQSLQEQATEPPIAIFAQAQSHHNGSPSHAQQDEQHQANQSQPEFFSAYFPFCEYSPEWVAIQAAKQQHAEVKFIDLDWTQQSILKSQQKDADWQQKSLMSERYFAHSQYIQKLAESMHCRNHDELWDHLFELQNASQLQQAQRFFDDVFVWCSLARLDYEREVLLREASLHREDVMWNCIQKVMDPEHKVLVVTGGFHSIALIENLSDTAQAERFIVQNSTQKWQKKAWLIRYSFDRLDALNGYASGMPSPAYYQHHWLNLNTQNTPTPADQQQVFFQYLNELCHFLNQQNALDITPYIALKNTAEIAWQLAVLRGHNQPSRYDLLDALQSALIKGEMDDGQQHLFTHIFQFLSGQRLGKVAQNQHSPALLQNTYQQIKTYRFNLNDTILRHRKLDIYRKPLHQEISQYLHLLEFVGCHFAQRISGPDFVQGASLDLLFEEWRYAWTPSVEARLIELAEMGNQLEQIALIKMRKLQQENEQQGMGQSAFETAKLLALACRLGLKQHLKLLNQQLDGYLESDQNLASVIGAAQQLYYLWHGRKLLKLPEQMLLKSLSFAVYQACFLLDQLYDTHEEKVKQNLKNLKSLHELILNIQQQKMPLEHHVFKTQDFDLLSLMYEQIDLTKLDEFHLNTLKGALHTLQFLDHQIEQQQLQQYLQLAFAAGSSPEDSVQYLHGMFFIAPEIFVQSKVAIDALHQLVSHWTEDTFIQILPDLRYIFSQLTPKQSTQVSKLIAQITGLGNDTILDQVLSHISEQDVLQGVQLNQQLYKIFAYDHLEHWVANSKQHLSEQQGAYS
ncbi:hypothetical protein KTH44_10500 [Acinetobacter bereziniae]|uniref:DUF5682 family protein n=1 Tax=Acinetobacter bereziniae TaxID=106648 RepID=UPI0021CDD8BC|nr:DUF5682 family protein [Acinetobacter bereziniae]MCU4319557.1 hypothetical protein [Acinetobacter bereziniae]